MPTKNGFKIFYAISLAWQLGFLIAVPLVGFLLLGLFLDHLFHTLPLFLILGIATTIAVSAYETYHYLIPLIEKHSHKLH